MKLPLLPTLLMFASSLVLPGHADVTLAENGKPLTAIYAPPRVMAADIELPKDAPYMEREAETQRRRLRESVNDLAFYLGKMAGTEISIHQEEPGKAETKKVLPILIGEYATARFGDSKQNSPYKQGWRATITGDAIGLQGESDESASYAIFEILDRLGCRWFMPGDLGEVIPQHPVLKLEEGDVSSLPDTAYRNVWQAYAGDAFVRRNRLGGFLINANHALEHYITEEQRKEHPEWRAIIAGKPHKLRLKWSNPEVIKALTDAIIAKLDANYVPSISLSPEDGAVFDETDDRKWDAGDWDPSLDQVSITDRYIVLCNRIAEQVVKKYPDVRFGFLAYVQYTRPPVREKLHPNLVPVIAPISYCRAHTAFQPDLCPSRAQIREIVEGWGRAAHQVAYYNYMYHLAEVSVPYPMIRQMSEELPLLYKNRVIFWQPETTPNFEEVLPGMWLSLRMAWNAKQNPSEILAAFYSTFYGAAAEPMRHYWEIFDAAWTKAPEHAGCLWSYSKRFTPEIMQSARETMNQALAAAQTPIEYRRVELQDRALRQFERFMQLRTDLNEGRLAKLDIQSTEWLGTQLGLAEEYADNYAFAKVRWTPLTVAGSYFNQFTEATYRDAARMAKTHVMLRPILREWKYAFLKDPGTRAEADAPAFDGVKQGRDSGWNKPDFDDSAWQTTDIGKDTWSDLGIKDGNGTMWYRSSFLAPKLESGKRLFLWLAGTDGSAEVFINGRHIPYKNPESGEAETALGYGQPFVFDITEAVKPGEANHVAIAGTRLYINELGTGGLLGPAFLFKEK